MSIDEFLLARIAEREAAAKAATPGPWYWTGDTDEDHLRSHDAFVIYASGMHTEGYIDCAPGDRAHIALNDPARVLADCKVKRWLVRFLSDMENEEFGDAMTWSLASNGLCRMATAHADHPDYREEWRP